MEDRPQPPTYVAPQIDLKQFFQIFFDETEENLEQLERMLLLPDWGLANDEAFHALFRYAHSIKGSAATFGFDDVAQVAHHMESTLDDWRKKLSPPNHASANAMLQGVDVLRGMVQAHANQKTVGAGLQTRAQQVVEQLEALRSGQSSAEAAVSEASKSAGVIPPRAEILMPARAEAATVVLSDADDFGFFDDAPGLPAPLQSEQIQQQQPLFKEDAVFQPAAAALEGAEWVSVSNTLRVPVERIDAMVNLLSEMVISQTALEQLVRDDEAAFVTPLKLQLEEHHRLLRALRDAVMHVRMVPVANLFGRFPRLIRDLSLRLGKDVQLHTEGDSTELDKGVIERITDPLTHLVRNALDHGIEEPQYRLRIGKNQVGRLSLRARHEGASVLIEVEDDGRGLNKEKLRASALAQGITPPQELTDAGWGELAMLPGLSTSEQITEISGRGVGMDVVKRNIEALGGRIDVRSDSGKGTCISLWLPLTLAITDGLLVRVAQENFVIPLSAVLESVPSRDVPVSTLAHSGNVVHLQDSYCPVIALDQLFGVQRHNGHDPIANATLVLLQAGGSKVAVLVDELLGQQQVVVKNVETHFRKIPYIAAATVLGDGGVALILDVTQLTRAQTTSTAKVSKTISAGRTEGQLAGEAR